MRRGAPACLAVALALVAVAGCQRRAQLVPAGADSLAALSDSFAIRVREAQQLWDQPDAGADAARLTAEIVRRDLGRHPDEPWPPRVRNLLDSLDVGAETADDRRALVVNFFSRAHPEEGSWPWAFWRVDTGAAARRLSGQGLQLLQIASRTAGAGKPVGLAVLFGRRAASGQEPMLMAWNDLGRGAEPSQTLGPDSLGGVGTAEFEVQGDTTIALVARTFRGLPRFEECATCPHVFTVRRFEWHGPSFLKTEERAVPSPYSSFVRFVLGVAANDGSALRWCSGPEVLELARNYDLGVAQRGIWRAAPATDESAHEMVFFRGQQEAYRVGFEMRGDQWVISGITPTTRTVE